MSSSYIKALKELFADMTSATPEKLQSFIRETMEYMLELRQAMQSQDPKKREEAMNTALELKYIIEGHMGVLGQAMGIDLSRVSETDLMGQMSEKDQEVFASAKEQFNELKSSMLNKKEKIRI